MTDQDPAFTTPAVPRERRPLAAAAVAAVGVYLVLTLGQLLETVFYALTGYAADLGYLRLILGNTIGPALAAAVPFAIATWLGLGVILPIRARHTTATVVGRALVATVFGLLGAAVVALGAAVVSYAASYIAAGYRVFSIDDLAQLAPRIAASAISTTSAMIVPGTLAVVLAAVLLRDRQRRRAGV
jgi:hypothetical protein